MITLRRLVADFAHRLQEVDSRGPVARNTRTGREFQPGVGPHTESATVELVVREMQNRDASEYGEARMGMPYPASPRQRCDLCLGTGDALTWAIEVKMLRLMGDNGKLNDNMLMHILSPYPQHRSALSDCAKLRDSGFEARKGILIYGYGYPGWPLGPAIEAFETLASRNGRLGAREEAAFDGLIHPVHQAGSVAAWELLA